MVADEALLAKLLKWGLSSVGRAPALQAGCHRFESVRLHQVSSVLSPCGLLEHFAIISSLHPVA